MRAPRNTATPEGLAEVASQGFRGTPEAGRAIVAQEKAGQSSFVNSDTLPSQMSTEARNALEKAGVKFGETVPGDDLFVYVELPAGWHKEGTSHNMHSSLLDDKGRKRAGIFYKAAFYDRRADLSISRRFGVRIDYKAEDETGAIVMHVSDGDNVVFSTDPRTYEGEKYREGYDAAIKTARDECTAWLASNGFPNWEDAGEYWD